MASKVLQRCNNLNSVDNIGVPYDSMFYSRAGSKYLKNAKTKQKKNPNDLEYFKNSRQYGILLSSNYVIQVNLERPPPFWIPTFAYHRHAGIKM